MTHPRTLEAAGKSGPVGLLARNRLCALARPGLDVFGETLLDVIVRPEVRLGTSTPKADPRWGLRLGAVRQGRCRSAGRPGAAREQGLAADRRSGLRADRVDGAPPGAAGLADFFLGDEGQEILAGYGYGFEPAAAGD